MARKALNDGGDVGDLASSTDDGIDVKPLYTNADWQSAANPSGFPGLPPYLRGRRAAGALLSGWDIRQPHAHPDLNECNTAIRQDVDNGVTSILLVADRAARTGLDSDTTDGSMAVGADGAMISTADDMATVFGGIDLAAVPVALHAGGAFLPFSAFLKEAWRRHGVVADAACGAFNADPLGALSADGALATSVDAALRQLAALAIATASDYPQVRSIGIDATPYHEAGATEAQELAYGLATGVAYLRALEAAGMKPRDAFAQMTVSHSVDADLFLSVAKLRAARRLWARLAEACGALEAGGEIPLGARSSRRMMARRDPWVNMLRTTIACFAAAVAGADSITLLPYDAVLGPPDAFSRRIARNTQLVLREESSLHRVLDPTGGAWALESITDALADKAWMVFQEVESAGGMVAAISDGTVAARIQDRWRLRERRLAHREETVIGVSDFPDLLERPVRTALVDLARLRTHAANRLKRHRSHHDAATAIDAVRVAVSGPGPLASAVDGAASDGATVAALSQALLRGDPAATTPLPRHRLGEAFEDLRDRSDAHALRTGERPCVYLAVIGEPDQYNARLVYSQNALAAAGIAVTCGPGGADSEATKAAFDPSKTTVAVLCSCAAVYASHAAEWVEALRDAGARKILVVGRDAASGDGNGRVASKIDAYMYDGCDMRGLLSDVLDEVGVLPK